MTATLHSPHLVWLTRSPLIAFRLIKRPLNCSSFSIGNAYTKGKYHSDLSLLYIYSIQIDVFPSIPAQLVFKANIMLSTSSSWLTTDRPKFTKRIKGLNERSLG